MCCCCLPPTCLLPFKPWSECLLTSRPRTGSYDEKTYSSDISTCTSSIKKTLFVSVHTPSDSDEPAWLRLQGPPVAWEWLGLWRPTWQWRQQPASLACQRAWTRQPALSLPRALSHCQATASGPVVLSRSLPRRCWPTGQWPVAGRKGRIETHVTTALIVAVLAGLQFPSKVRLQCRPRVPLTEYNGTGKTFVSFQIGDYLKTVVFCSVSKEQNDRTC